MGFPWRIVPAMAVLALALPAAGLAQPQQCTDLPEECDTAVDCGATLDGHFEVAFVGATYDGVSDTTTFTYQLCELMDDPNLSHWVLGLVCTDLLVASSDPDGMPGVVVSPDPTTCLDGVKFETPDSVETCGPECGSNGSFYSVTLAGNVPVGIIPAGVTVATKAGQLSSTICIEGPACGATTTTSTSTTTTPTTSSTSTTEVVETTTTTTTDTEPTTTTTTTMEEPTTTSTTTTEPSTTTTATTSTTTSTTVACLDDGDCDDGNPCTTDVCAAGACENDPITGLPAENACNDMQDNDCDGLVDCLDPDCARITPCRPARKDPTLIRFGSGVRRDLFRSNARVEPGAVDPSRVEVDWLLTNPAGTIYKGALIPGDLKPNAAGTTWQFRDLSARTGRGKRFGIYKAKIKKRRNSNAYTYRVEVYGNLSAATHPNMRIQFYLGDEQPFITTDAPWKRTPSGWKAPKDH